MAPLWLLLVLLVAAPSASAAPVQLLPASGERGASATIVASQLPPRSEVELRVGQGEVQRLRANGAGVLTTRQRIPRQADEQVPIALDGVHGTHAVVHYEVRSRWSPVASFASADWRGRAARVVTDLSGGRLRTVVRVRGLVSGTHVTATYGGRRVGRATAGRDGRARVRALLPQEAVNGQLVVKGTGDLRLATTLPTPPATVVVAADIACEAPYETRVDRCRHAEVAALAQSRDPDVLVMPGDVQYGSGTTGDFRRSFGRSWGRLDTPLRPAPGDHDYGVPGAAGYFDYFEMQSGWRPPAWYAYNVGYWRLIALNSNCEESGVACGPDSEQEQWLRANLATEPSRCTLAYWHHPRYSSGSHGTDPRTASMWRTLDDAGAEVVLSGHDRHYERFALQDADGQQDDAGMRQFVVGTGGSGLSAPRLPAAPHSEYAQSGRFGVLSLGLYGDVYTWRFIGLNGRTLDKGIGGCF